MDQEIDNRWIVLYNKLLLRSMNCHCNVEPCMSIKSIKYVLKYVYKGCDQAMFALRSSQVDEILDNQNAWYVSSNEAAWRILEFPIHERDHPVQQLAVHLENGQRVYFTETMHWIVLRGICPRPHLQNFLALCRVDSFAKTLLYADVPKYYTWNKKVLVQMKARYRCGRLCWHQRSTRSRKGLHHPPRQGECFYLDYFCITSEDRVFCRVEKCGR